MISVDWLMAGEIMTKQQQQHETLYRKRPQKVKRIKTLTEVILFLTALTSVSLLPSSVCIYFPRLLV